MQKKHHNKQNSKQSRYILIVVASIQQALNVLNDYLSVIQVVIDITMLVVTIERDHEIGLFDGVFGDPLFLLLLFAFPMIIGTKIGSELLNSDALTLEFDAIDDTWLIMNVKMKTTGCQVI